MRLLLQHVLSAPGMLLALEHSRCSEHVMIQRAFELCDPGALHQVASKISGSDM